MALGRHETCQSQMLVCVNHIWYPTIVHGQVCSAGCMMNTAHAVMQGSVKHDVNNKVQ